MKLATLNDGSRDGRLVVVSSDLTRMTPAGRVAPTLQRALDDWDRTATGLEQLALELDLGQVEGEPFDPAGCMAPLPRAYQFLDASAYLNHVALAWRTRGEEMPETARDVPLMYQGGSDSFFGPRQPVPVERDAWGVDFEAEIVVVTSDVPMGISRERAAGCIRLLMLMNDVSLRRLAPAELATGFGFVHAKPPSSFSPVAVTPSELGEAWDGGKVNLPLRSSVNGEIVGQPEAGEGMGFDFAALIAHAAATRPLGAGTLIGAGTVSNGSEDGYGKSVADGGRGFSCLMEQRMVEKLDKGDATTQFLRLGDVVRIEMLDGKGRSVFGAIEQEMVLYTPPASA